MNSHAYDFTLLMVERGGLVTGNNCTNGTAFSPVVPPLDDERTMMLRDRVTEMDVCIGGAPLGQGDSVVCELSLGGATTDVSTDEVSGNIMKNDLKSWTLPRIKVKRKQKKVKRKQRKRNESKETETKAKRVKRNQKGGSQFEGDPLPSSRLGHDAAC
jgi:hypothetical protein